MTTRLLVSCLLFASGCSLLLDTNTVQCTTDADCEHFGGHPSCQEGVCVPSGLGPEGCFFGTPTTDEEFQNQCSTAECIPFDNCARFGYCTPSDTLPLVAPPTATAAPAPVIVPPTPAVNCADVGPNIIYVTGSTNFPPLLKAVAPLLLADTPSYYVVWQSTSSCNGVETIFNPDPTKHLIKDVPPVGSTPANWAFYYNADGTTTTCYLDPAGNVVDVGQTDVYAQTCNPAYAPNSTIAGYLGPIQTMTFVVPSSSTQRSLSAEAAHYVFGAGSMTPTGPVAPWTDPALYFIRSPTTGTNQMISKVIDVPPTKWWGVDRRTAANLSLLMQGVDPTSAERAIGVLSNDAADRARDNLRILAFQAFKQRCGYLPDSTTTSLDKRNVRDGHYPIWGPVHLYTAISGGVPTPAANALITKLTVPKPNQALLDAIIDAGFVPQCAMQVSRTDEVGKLSAFAPPYHCGCYFDYRTNGLTTCQACTGPAQCPANKPACNNGYCEAQ